MQQVHCGAIFESQLSVVYMKTKQEGLSVSIFSFHLWGGRLIMAAFGGCLRFNINKRRFCTVPSITRQSFLQFLLVSGYVNGCMSCLPSLHGSS